MNTVALWRSFEWKTLTLRWHARCADPALTPAIVIRKAAALLETRYLAVVKVSPNGDALRFRHSLGDISFRWLLMGRVTATDRDGEVTVVAGGSVALLLLLPLVVCALLFVDHKPDAVVAAVAAVVLPAIAYVAYVATSDALKELSADVVKPD